MIQNDNTPQQPVQIRRQTPWGRDRALDVLADWARIYQYWYAEHWPIIPELARHSEPGAPTTFTPARAFAAVAIGDRGIIAVRRAPGPETLEECRDESDERACQLSSLVGSIKGAYRKREWVIPVRIATIGSRHHHLDDLWASVDTLELATLREWIVHWTDDIDRGLAKRAWSALLPRTRWSKSNDSDRQSVLEQALAPKPVQEIAPDIAGRAAGLRCVLDVIDGEHGIARTPLLPRQPTAFAQAQALEATEVVSTIHAGIAMDPELVPTERSIPPGMTGRGRTR